MTVPRLETAVPLTIDRNVSPLLAAPFAQGLQAAGVDYIQTWDQVEAWAPRQLWRPDVTPLAEIIPDPDSFADPFLLAALAAGATDNLGVAVSTDAIRRGPGELMMAMLTLAAATEGRAALMVGAGEAKQIKPFGYKRSEGLGRLEDHLRLYRMLLDCEEPFDFDGNYVKYRNAWIGGARPYKPKVWAMGGGPKLVEMSTKYADGISSAARAVLTTPDKWAAMVKTIREGLERNGRDPDDFTYGLWFLVCIHDDDAIIDATFKNPLVRFSAATMGRFKHSDWADEGYDLILPENYHYALHMLPSEISRAECERIAAAVPDQMVRDAYLSGSAKQVAAQMQEYVDAGANWVQVCDITQVSGLLPIEEAPEQVGRQLEVMRILKENARALGN